MQLLVALLLVSLPADTQGADSADRVQFGHDIVIEAGETAKDAVCNGCSIHVRGRLEGDAVAVGGSVEVDGYVGRDVVAIGGNVRVGQVAAVGGEVVTVGGRVERHPQASVKGEVTKSPGLPIQGLGWLLLVGFMLLAVTNLVLVLVSYLIAGERRVETVATTVRTRAGMALLTGVGVAVAAVVLFIVSSKLGPLTPVLAILVAVALLITLLVGYTGLSSWFGRALARRSAPLVAVLLGTVLISLLQAIPLLGFLAFLVFLFLALGSAALSGYGSSPDWLSQQFGGRPANPTRRLLAEAVNT